MTIAINFTNLLTGIDKQPLYYQFQRLAAYRKKDQFLFIISKQQATPNLPATDNIRIITSGRGSHPFLCKYWYHYTLPVLLKKYAVQLLIHTDNACSYRTAVNQVLYLSEKFFLNDTNSYAKRQHLILKKQFAKSAERAAKIIVPAHCIKEQVAGLYEIIAEKIMVAPPAIDTLYQPCNLQQQEITKEQYSEGKEFFLYTGGTGETANLINLLKAFSLFKKRQKSNLLLLICTPELVAGKSFASMIDTYKYRSEVKIYTGFSTSELAMITAAAYAFVYPVMEEIYSVEPIQAMHCNTPLLLSNAALWKETAGGAACYFEPAEVKDIAEKMMLLFKNESIRNQLIKAAQLNIQKTTAAPEAMLWQVIEQATATD